ncbi:MAG: polysaccharide deacetylase family protein [Saprospiraceae bacterium]|nr:polysaccharide deacetylase family protein [Saprospiraceae bacterium]
MYRIFFVSYFMVCSMALGAQNTAERLGYARDAKLLIVHADDAGSAQSVNAATISALEEGMVSSASVMVPCPWFPDIARYAAAHDGQHDLGIHLTVTCEWDYYKWGPATNHDVSSLTDENGYFFADCQNFGLKADLAEIETELRAQIDKAIAHGLKPTHIDSHMGCLFFTRPEVFGIYLELAEEYGVPALVSKSMMALAPDLLGPYMEAGKIVIEAEYSASPENFDQSMAAFYSQTLRNLQPGLSTIIIHVGYDNDELRAVCENHPYWGSAWRQADYDYFTSDECRNILKEEKIHLVTWRQVGEALKKN